MSKALSFPSLLLVLALLVLGANTGLAQSTEFTYQGKLVDGALPANANYDFEFRLFATDSGGAAIATQTRLGVPVAYGIFTVSLDFGGQFDGSARWLEIAVKPAGSPNPLTVLTPRQPITSTPHSIRSLSSARADQATNSLQLGGVNASQYVLTTDSRMTDARSPLPNSSNYIQNTAGQQSSSNFNISGNGTAGGTLSANAVNAATQFNLGGNRVLSNAGTFNLFAGVGAGTANTTGQSNSFFGRSAGLNNTAGGSNAFFGDSSGTANTTGDQNSFFGFFGGINNTTGARNSYFGYRAGQQSTTNNDNSFFGYRAGFANTANGNSFFGVSAGELNTTAEGNSFFGYQAGSANTGDGNSYFGYQSGFASNGAVNSFFGYNAGANTTGFGNAFFGYKAGAANTLGYANSIFGREAGIHNTIGIDNAFFGERAGLMNTTGAANSFFGSNAGRSNLDGTNNSFFGTGAGENNKTGEHNTIVGSRAEVGSANLSFATAIGAEAVVSTSNTIVLGRSAGQDDVRVPGAIAVIQLGSAGSTDVCRNAANFLSTCSSSLRYKTDIQQFSGGLNLINHLRPITFDWKDSGRRDVGFGAEDVEKVEPLLVTYNAKGEIEGVKYGQLTTVLVNSIKQQQQIIERQQRQLDALKRLVCRSHRKAPVCR